MSDTVLGVGNITMNKTRKCVLVQTLIRKIKKKISGMLARDAKEEK